MGWCGAVVGQGYMNAEWKEGYRERVIDSGDWEGCEENMKE
jgi:hypothetical protein